MPVPETREEQVLRSLIELLADRPEAIVIDAVISGSSAVYDIHVDDVDVGQVLGRGGSHAEALRTLFGAVYAKLGKRLVMQVVDPRRS